VLQQLYIQYTRATVFTPCLELMQNESKKQVVQLIFSRRTLEPIMMHLRNQEIHSSCKENVLLGH